MKKLFFAALVAIVAVGGALSANAELLYAFQSDTGVECEIGGEATCAAALEVAPNAIVYTTSDSEGQGPEDAVLVSDYNYIP